uniref:DRBM domain-containing protein n=1 Tax=Neogobius melanostomus TaxID=47308 RepID=A0A8C6SHK2_9GOBI
MLEKLESLAPISNKKTVPVDKSLTEMENGTVNTEPHDRPDFGLGKDPTMRLSELQMARKQPYVTYRQLQGEIKRAELLFSIEATLDKVTAVGSGYTKKEAKRRASTALLQKMGYQTLREEPTPVDRSLQKPNTVNQSQTTAPPTSKRNKTPEQIRPDFGLGKDPCSRLSELQMLRREKYAVYRTLAEKVVDNNYGFTIEASLNQFTATGNGRTKKEAKKRNILQIHQVTSEHHSREEQHSGETSHSQERAENLHTAPVVKPEDLQASVENSESQADEKQSPLHGSESQREQQTPEEREQCSPETIHLSRPRNLLQS